MSTTSEVDGADILNTADFQIQLEGAFEQDKQDAGVQVTISSKELKAKLGDKKDKVAAIRLQTIREMRKL
jgi:hypothetical protein